MEQINEINIWRTMFGSDTGGQILICDTIEYKGGLWLVPDWIKSSTEGWRTPVRIIRMDLLPHQKLKIGTDYPANFLLNGPMPKSVLDGLSRSSEGVEYEVVEFPDILVPLSKPSLH